MKILCLKEIGSRAQNMVTILSSTMSKIKGGGATWLFDEHKNPHFDNVERTRDIHMRYGNDKESGYGLGLELITSFLLIVCSIS